MPSRISKGFTLVEVLIALGVLSLVLLLLTTAFFNMTQSAQASTELAQTNDERRAVREFLSRQISQIKPLSFREHEDLVVYFSGSAEKIRYTGQLPSHRGGGGLHFIQISKERYSDNLVIMDVPAWPSKDFSDSGSLDEWRQSLLLEKIDSLEFSYYGSTSASDNPKWHREWLDQGKLPSLIKIEIVHSDNGLWPPLVVPVYQFNVAGQANLVW